MVREYPIIEYAQKIGKNTAEFTVKDLAAFMKWWLKQAPREDLILVNSQQQAEYNKDLIAMNKYRAAQHSRLPIEVLEQGIESPINDGEEEIVIHADEIVCTMELNRKDVEALKWAIGAAMNDYNADEETEVTLKGLLEALEGV